MVFPLFKVLERILNVIPDILLEEDPTVVTSSKRKRYHYWEHFPSSLSSKEKVRYRAGGLSPEDKSKYLAVPLLDDNTDIDTSLFVCKQCGLLVTGRRLRRFYSKEVTCLKVCPVYRAIGN